jgi:hypothetical protein
VDARETWDKEKGIAAVSEDGQRRGTKNNGRKIAAVSNDREITEAHSEFY